jgi:hypothetical protein
VHGLRGHPRHTWEDNRGTSGENSTTTTPSKRKLLKSLLKSKPSTSTPASADEEHRSQKLFWPDEFLTEDIPDARIWTYGYNADVLSGFLQANNNNSVSQHGRDLSLQVERDVDNEVVLLIQ